MNKPNIKWVPSPNHSSEKGYKFIAIVNHIMSGSLSGTDSWFQNPISGVSSHFGIGKNGEVHQYVDLKCPSWANGGVYNPNWSLLKEGVNPNYYTISIEYEGYSGDQFTEAQYQSALSLHKWLIEYLGIEVNNDTIIGHYRIDSVNKSRCPGSGFPWNRLFNDLGEIPTTIILPPSPSQFSQSKSTISYGSQGSDVVILQNLLNSKGFSCGIADGIFGNLTKNALIDFQESNGLTPDSICGLNTWNKLLTNNKPVQQISIPSCILRKGSTGSDVVFLQETLNNKFGYHLQVDGEFGNMTKNAVIDFQGSHKIGADSIVGRVTWTELLK